MLVFWPPVELQCFHDEIGATYQPHRRHWPPCHAMTSLAAHHNILRLQVTVHKAWSQKAKGLSSMVGFNNLWCIYIYTLHDMITYIHIRMYIKMYLISMMIYVIYCIFSCPLSKNGLAGSCCGHRELPVSPHLYREWHTMPQPLRPQRIVPHPQSC